MVRPMRPLEQREGAIEPREACSRIGFRPRVRVLDQRVVDSGLGAWGEAVLRAPAARQKEQEMMGRRADDEIQLTAPCDRAGFRVQRVQFSPGANGVGPG